VLDIKLKKLDDYNEARQKAAAFYSNAFANHPKIKTPVVANDNTHVFHQYTLQLNGVDRNELVDYLSNHGIPAMIYYPVPAHRQKMFSFLNLPEVELPVTDQLTGKVVSLPIHTELDQEQLDYIVQHVLNFVNK
jgi:dTDP-4-amino-4,6-dideoxygalactose transaminase